MHCTMIVMGKEGLSNMNRKRKRYDLGVGKNLLKRKKQAMEDRDDLLVEGVKFETESHRADITTISPIRGLYW